MLDREVSHITQAANEIEKAANGEKVKAKDITVLLGGMVEKLQVRFFICKLNTIWLKFLLFHYIFVFFNS